VYPVLFRIGIFEITSFGVLVAIATLVGIWLFGRELARRGLPREGVDAAIAGVIGGFLGAKLLWTVEFLGQQPVTNLLFGRGGFSWFGGLIGGVGVGLWMLRRRQVPAISALAAATPALAVGHAIGRVGCFMVGDDYGRPSNLPWAVAFPEGLPPTDVPVHPTQLYEAIALAALAWAFIRWRRADVDDAVVLGRYLVLAGSTRFAIEFISVNARLFGPFTLAQLIMSKARQRFADGTSADWVGVEGDRRPALVTKLIADR
jgi:phosphatidylglycerol:prolipoprotein diacylglycerol transferase